MTDHEQSDRLVVDLSGWSAEPHTACPCRVCDFVMANDLLPAGHWDCHDYPRPESAAGVYECSDPHAVGCICPGTLAAGTPCAACTIATGPAIGWPQALEQEAASYALWIMFTEGRSQPREIVDERSWPYTTASLRKIERICGLPVEQARQILDQGTMVCASLMWFRRVPVELARSREVLRSEPMPHVILMDYDESVGVTLREPCDCAVCVLVTTHGWLDEAALDCGDFPWSPGSGPCSDPHSIGCHCLGTQLAAACEACGMYDDPLQVAKIVAHHADRQG